MDSWYVNSKTNELIGLIRFAQFHTNVWQRKNRDLLPVLFLEGKAQRLIRYRYSNCGLMKETMTAVLCPFLACFLGVNFLSNAADDRCTPSPMAILARRVSVDSTWVRSGGSFFVRATSSSYDSSWRQWHRRRAGSSDDSRNSVAAQSRGQVTRDSRRGRLAPLARRRHRGLA